MEKFFEKLFNGKLDGKFEITSVYLGSLLFSVLLLWIFTRVLRAYVKRKIGALETTPACETNLTTKAFDYFLKRDGALILTTLRGTFWFGTIMITVKALSLYFRDIQPLLQFAKVPNSVFAKVSQILSQASSQSTTVALIILGALWASRFLESASNVIIGRAIYSGTSGRGKLRSQTLKEASGYIIRFAVFVIVSMTLLQTLGVSTAPILATAGVVSVAIGLGAQQFVRDLIGGFFILIEDQFAVGDYIEVDTFSGKVESMTLRVTRVRNSEGALIVLPNGDIRKVKNLTTGWSQIDYKISVAADSDITAILEALGEEAQSLYHDFPQEVMEAADVLGVDKIEGNTVTLRLIIKTKPTRQWQVKREFNKRVLNRMRRENVTFVPPPV